MHLLPLLKPIGTGVAWVAGKLGDFLKAHPILTKVAVAFGAVATAVGLVAGPVLALVGAIGALGGVPVVLGAVSAGLGSLGAVGAMVGAALSAAFWPVTLVALAVGALYLAFKTNFLGIRDIAMAVGKVWWTYIVGVWEGAKAALEPLIGTFRETWAVLKDAFAPLWEVVEIIGELVGFSLEGSDSMETFKKVAAAVGKVVGFALVLPLRLLLTAVAYVVRGFAWLLKSAVALGKWLGGKLGPYITTAGKALSYLSGPIGTVVAGFGKVKDAAGSTIEWISSNWGSITGVVLAPVEAIRTGWTALAEGLTAAFTAVADTVTGVFAKIEATIAGVIEAVWDKVTWIISKIPDVFLPKSLERIKYGRSERGAAVGGQFVVPATASATQRAVARPTIPRDAFAMPALAFAGAGGGSVDRSVHVHAGAIQIHANRVDERLIARIDQELGKLLERRQERR